MTDSKPSTLRVVEIIPGTTVDGPGFRTAIYFAGCGHKCPGCHNPSTWPFDAGQDMTIDEIMQIIDAERCDVTFSGGDPMYQAESIIPLAKTLKESGYNIWCYTGFKYEEIKKIPAMSALLPYLDVLVDGPFIESQKDISLLFRGSANQRLIDLHRTNGDVAVNWESDF